MARSNHSTCITTDDVLAHLVINMPGYLYWKDKQGVYLGCNDYHAQRLGLKAGTEVMGKLDKELLGKESNQYFSKHDELVLSQGQTRVIEEEFMIRGQRTILLSLNRQFWVRKSKS